MRRPQTARVCIAVLLPDTLTRYIPARSHSSKQDKPGSISARAVGQPLLAPDQSAHLLSAAVVRLFQLLGSVLGFVALCLLPAIKVKVRRTRLLMVVRHQRADMMQPSTLSVQQTLQRVILDRLAQIGEGSRLWLRPCDTHSICLHTHRQLYDGINLMIFQRLQMVHHEIGHH
jgi:hypothetical protein